MKIIYIAIKPNGTKIQVKGLKGLNDTRFAQRLCNNFDEVRDYVRSLVDIAQATNYNME